MSVKTKKQKKTKITWYQQNIFVLVLFLFLSVGALVGTLITVHTAPKNSAKAAGLGKALYGVAAGNAVQRLTPSQFAQQLDGYKALGVQWIRFDFDWVQIQSGGPTSYDWTNYDAAVAAANARGIKVLGTIGYTASWALPASCSDPYFCPPNNTSDYAAFAKAVATRYAPMGVHTWEIWNEPNAGNGQWLRFTLASYTALLKAAYPAIKQVDPTAFVLTGGTAPAGTGTYTFSPLDFLSGIYANGGKGYFDAVAHHPYCYSYTACPPKGVDGDAWQQMQDTNPSLRSIMIANGDQNKQIWATEFGAPTGGGTHDYNLPITEAQQAQMVTDAYTLFNTYTWAGPLFWYTYQDPCTTTTSIECYFGLVRADGSLKPAYSVYQNLATSAALPTPTTTISPTVTVQPTPTPQAITPTLTQGFTQVVTLAEAGTSARRLVKINFALETTRTLTVNNLIVAIRDAKNNNADFGVKTNYILKGLQSFSASSTLPVGTYTYWVAYYNNGTWTNLSPTKSFHITK